MWGCAVCLSSSCGGTPSVVITPAMSNHALWHVHVHMNTNVNVDVDVHAGGDEHGTQGHHRRLSGDRGPHYPHMIIIVANEKGTLRDQCHRTKKL